LQIAPADRKRCVALRSRCVVITSVGRLNVIDYKELGMIGIVPLVSPGETG